MVELFTAALAFYVCLNVQAGWISDCAFVVMLIASVSTVLFNGNPLLRFDGYHLLCDVVDLPNLDTRSRAWWSNLLQRRVFAMDAPAQPLAPGEHKWLLLYAPLALLYRVYIGLLIALWVSVKSTLLGVVTAAAAIFMLVILPGYALVRTITQTAQGVQRQRSLHRLWIVAAVALVLLTVVPLPYGTVTEAVVWLPEQAEVRAQIDGFVRDLQVRDGDTVNPGQVLAVLDDPVLLAKQAEAHQRLLALRVQYFNTLQSDRLQAQNFFEALAHAEAEATHIDARIAQLEMRSRIAGRMVITRQDDMPGTFLKRGQPLGYVFTPGEIVVRAVVPDEDATLVRSRTRSAAVWLEERPGALLSGRVTRDVPAASFKLPSAALADRNGGTVVTDPADNDHLRTLQPIFTVDVTLPEHAIERIGGRAWVRFDFGPEPLAFQWARAMGQLLLKHFEKAV
jgi:putative peptide zinc metalloprotease protein